MKTAVLRRERRPIQDRGPNIEKEGAEPRHRDRKKSVPI